MKNKKAIVMMVGIPGSGKSFLAKGLGLKIVSSDEVRAEMYENYEDADNKLVFEEVHKRIRDSLKDNDSVIFDATNINRSRRIKFIKEFHEYDVICFYLDATLDLCILRDKSRNKPVGEEVIRRIHNNLQVPLKSEGFVSVFTLDS